MDTMKDSFSQSVAKALAIGGAAIETYDTVNFLRSLSCPAGSWQAQAATAIQMGKIYVSAVSFALGGAVGASFGPGGAFVGSVAVGGTISAAYDAGEKVLVHQLGCD